MSIPIECKFEPCVVNLLLFCEGMLSDLIICILTSDPLSKDHRDLHIVTDMYFSVVCLLIVQHVVFISFYVWFSVCTIVNNVFHFTLFDCIVKFFELTPTEI